MMENCAKKCEIGLKLNESCELTEESDFYVLNKEEIEILELRTQCSPLTKICQGHRKTFLTQYVNHQRACCDPLLRHHGKKPKKGLREISLIYSNLHKHLNLVPGKKICTPCRKEVSSHSYLVQDAEPEPGPSHQSDIEPDASDEDEPFESSFGDISLVNKSISSLGESPFTAKKLVRQKRRSEQKLKRVNETLRKKLRMDNVPEEKDAHDNSKELEIFYHEMISQLKEKFEMSGKRSEQMQVLTVLPSSWTIRKIQDEFGVTNFMARAAKKLAKEKGVLSTPNPKPGRSVPETIIEQVKRFYESDDVSRQMPGKKDCVAMNVNGKKTTVQKRLILCNLKECYQKFKEKSVANIGFSKFASLRPRNVVLPGGSGTHTVCVCAIHQNVKLMLDGSKISSLPQFRALVGGEGKLTYRHLLACLACNPPQPGCLLSHCSLCGKTDKLKSDLLEIFEEFAIDEVTFKLWVNVDRTNLETVVKSTEDFVEDLIDRLCHLQRHSFIATQQSQFMKEIKEGPMDGEVLVIGDFAENYSFVLQDEIQGYHWTNSQATIHPFVVYHRLPVEGNESSDLKEISFVVISDHLSHDTVVVYHFQCKLIKFLKEIMPFKKVIYFSDGAASQYKNRKNFINLVNHEADFGMPADWHFFATSHGKGPCDGVAGTVKRLAARASLQRPYENQIQTPLQLFQWAKDNVKSVHFEYATSEEILETGKRLTKRFLTSKAIEGTQKLHAFVSIPNCKTKIKV